MDRLAALRASRAAAFVGRVKFINEGSSAGGAEALSSSATMSDASDNKHDQATCPCCGEVFVCKMNRPLECRCNEVLVTPDEAMDISFAWNDQCLCPACLCCERDKLRLVC